MTRLSPLPLLSLAVLACLLSPLTSALEWHQVTAEDPHVYAVTYHTPTSTYIPGCPRTFTFVSLASPSLAFNLTVARLSPQPLISSQTHSATHYGGSLNDFNFNAAYVPLPQASGPPKHALLVRAQNATSRASNAPASPSHLFLAFDSDSHSNFRDISSSDLSFYPTSPLEDFGTEDPRVVYNPHDARWYLFYSAVRSKPAVHSDLWVASTPNILDPTAWQRHGPVCQNGQWSKSGALLLLPPPSVSLLFFGDSNNGKGMQLATTPNLINYTIADGIWLPIRPLPYFDNALVEGGPPPERLSSGDYLFIHNSAGAQFANGSGYPAVYNVAFVLLNGSDPSHIIFRTPVSILACEMGWEVGVDPWLKLTPYVVFTEGMRRYEEGGKDSFLFYYGGADSVVGAAVATVTFYEGEEKVRLVKEARTALERREMPAMSE